MAEYFAFYFAGVAMGFGLSFLHFWRLYRRDRRDMEHVLRELEQHDLLKADVSISDANNRWNKLVLGVEGREAP